MSAKQAFLQDQLHGAKTEIATLRADNERLREALEQIAALGTYTAQERPFRDTIAMMQGEACKVLRAALAKGGAE